MADFPESPLSGVAVVGMSGRFPGADTVDAFWRNLVAGVESISRFSLEDLRAQGVAGELLNNPDFVPARGLISEPEGFDAAFFGISQRDAELMDPQQRLFLETCWLALEHAGIAPATFAGQVGVWGGMSTGMSNNTYLLSNLHAHGRLNPDDVLPAMLGNENDYLTTRVSYKLNLRGPSVNVQSACSTSLVAVAQACQALLTWQCDAALAGGVSVSYPQKDGYLYQEGGIGSPDGHCRPFDARAEGTVFSNGVGIVVLRRLEDALADGQTIYAVIRGVATNNDGSAKVSFAAPSVDGQADVITTALGAADVHPGTIDYIEAHGTGTPLGDPIEVGALTRAYRAAGAEGVQYCGLGSVKSNLGHLDSAAGITGFIKTVLALYHAQIPPTLHFETPNPKCQLGTSPFYVPARLQAWPRRGHRRRAAVSSFGIGGTNAHVILEEAPDVPAPVRAERPSELVVLSAKTESALAEASRRLSDHLERHPDLPLADVAATLQLGRQALSHRRVVVGGSVKDVVASLSGRDTKRGASGVAAFGSRAVAMMFPGGGTQYVDMARGLMPSAPVFREAIDTCLAMLRPEIDIRAALFPENDEERGLAAGRLEQPSWGLPALFAVEYALARQWMAWGVQPTALIGHSMGEYTAACLAGVMTLDEALALVLLRGRLFEQLPPGEMLGVPLSEAEVTPYLGASLAIAAINAPSSCVVSGSPEALGTFAGAMSDAGIECRRLHIAVAAHSPMVEPILGTFESFLRRCSLQAPTIPIVSNVTGTWLTADEAQSPEYWARHLRQTVRFADGLATLVAEPNRVLLEAGPGQALSTFARQHPHRQDSQLVQPSVRHPKENVHDFSFLQLAAGRLWAGGVDIDWSATHDGDVRRIALPTYPFERKRFYVDPPQTAPVAAPAAGSSASVVPHAEPRSPEVTVMTQPTAPVPPPPAKPRAERVCDRLVEILHKLSGVPVNEIDPRASFLEMGFDSLFLTQASLKFKGEFGVRITFRQLFEDAPTLEALAAYIDGKMPADKFPAPASAVPAVAQVPAAGAAAPAAVAQVPVRGAAISQPALTFAASPASASAMERVIQQQLQVMAEQLRMMGGGALELASAPAADVVPVSVTDTPAPATASSATDTPAPVKAHGPFKPINKSAGSELTPQQSAALQTMIARYVARTPKSKQMTAENRPVFADARSVSGFHRMWKEMVYPILATRSEGSKIWDVDGNEYVDVVMGFGSNLFGHRPKFIADALAKQIEIGFEIGPLQPMAGDIARMISELTGMERVAFTNTGSEAVLAATRVARTISGKDKLAIFDGSYHGVFDEMLLRPLTTNGETRTVPVAPGIPGTAITQVLVLEYDNPQSLDIIREQQDEIAAVLIEPVQSRRLELQPKAFMQQVRKVTEELGIALIFDEVITGFRVHPGGAQAYFGVKADLASYGKVVGGGMPIGVVAGDSKYMDALDGGQWKFGDDSFPEIGVTYFAGTFVRHPLSLAAARAVLQHLKQEGPQLQLGLEARTAALARDLQTLLHDYGAPLHLTQFSSVMHLHYPADYKFGGLLFFLLREKGLHIWDGRPFFFTTAHTDADFDLIRRAFDESLAEMRAGGFFGAPDPTTPGPGHHHRSSDDETVPFTDAQMELWLGGQMSESAATSFNEIVAIDFDGPLDVIALQRAIDQVVDRHEALRFTVSADPPGFRKGTSAKVVLAVEDVTALDPAAREARLQAVIRDGDARPFDMANGPLVRMAVVKMSDTHHVFVMAAHHLVCDGWAFGIVLRELGLCYTAEVTRKPAVLDEPMQASDYARLVVSDEHQAVAREALDFWMRQYQTLPDPLQLPADRRRPLKRSTHGGRIGRHVPGHVTQAFKSLAARERVTLFTGLLGVFETLVFRLSGQEDFVVGIPMAAQSGLENPNLVAHCVNFVPLRCTLDGASSFVGHLSVLRQQSFDISEYQNFTYSSLLANLRIPRDPSRDPLVSVSFTLEPLLADVPLHGLRTRMLTVARSTAKRDMHVNVMELPDGLLVEADFNRDIYDEATVERWLSYFETIMSAIVETPDRAMRDLQFVSAAEHTRLIDQWSGPTAVYPMDRLVHQRAADWATGQPDRLAVVCEQDRLTWAQLEVKANQLAGALATRGAGAGTVVALCLDRSVAFIVAVLASLKTGAAYVPLDPSFPDDRLAYVIKDAGAAVVVTTNAHAARIDRSAVAVIAVDGDAAEIAAQPAEFGDRDVAHDALAYIIYTSGTTGAPKGVGIEHRQLMNYIGAVGERMGVGDGASYALVSTVAADLGLTSVFPPLATGGTIHVITPDRASDARAFGEYMTAQRIDVLKITPSHLGSLVDGSSSAALPARCLVVAGEPAHPAFVTMLRALAPQCRIVNSYGPTETTVGATTYEVTGDVSGFVSVPIGRPMGNVRAYVLDPSAAIVPVGVPGELYIGGAGVARGYLGREELTRERFVPNPFAGEASARMYRTGDRVRWRNDGQLEFLGRFDSQVKIRGFRVELGEVEAVLRAQPGVKDVVVLLRDGAATEPRLVAYVIGDQTLSVDDVKTAAKRTLPAYAVPSDVVRVDRWPLTANGKIDRKALPAPVVAFPTAVTVNRTPQTDTEVRLAALWAELLRVPAVSRDDDFFLLGGHSLLAIRLVHRIHTAFGVALPPGALLEFSTLAPLAAYLDDQMPRAALVPVPVAAAAPTPQGPRTADPNRILLQIAKGSGVPFFWVHGVGGEVFSYMQVSKHLGRPVYAFAADWTKTFAPEDRSIDRIAQRYVAELRQVQPVGPYHLGAFCSGAVLLVEMARQLEAAGETIGMFAILDYDIVLSDGQSPLKTALAFVKNLPRWVTDDALPSGTKELFGRVRSRLRRAFGPASPDNGDIRDAIGMWRFPDYQVEMLRVHHQVIHSFTPRPIQAGVTLFLPRTGPLFGPWPNGFDREWDHVARGGVEIEAVRGSHSTMLVEPFASELAARLGDGIVKAERRLGIATPGREDVAMSA